MTEEQREMLNEPDISEHETEADQAVTSSWTPGPSTTLKPKSSSLTASPSPISAGASCCIRSRRAQPPLRDESGK